MSWLFEWTEAFGIYWSQNQNSLLLLGFVFVILALVKTGRVRAAFRKRMGAQYFREEGAHAANRPLKNALYLLGSLLVIIAALGPQWGQKAHTVKAQGLDICFAIDLSRSMLVEDVSPSRLQAVKNQLALFLPQMGGDRAAIVAFAGSGYIAAPLSPDANALSGFLDPLDPSFISDQGTSFGAALENCFTALKLDQAKDAAEVLDDAAKLIVLLSDGDDNVNEAGPAIARAVKLGVPIFAVAVGTEQGGAMAIRDARGTLEGYVKDPRTGQPVIVKLLDKGLKEIAKKAGGQVFYASQGTEAWKQFREAIANYKRDSREAGTKLDREERFQWPLLVGLLLLCLEFLMTETRFFRRKGALVILLAAFGAAHESHAGPNNPLQIWDNNRAVKKFEAKDFAAADAKFLEALSRDATDLGVRYNWATNKMVSAIKPPAKEGDEPEKPDGHLVDEALKEFQSLNKEPATNAKENSGFRKALRYQMGQAFELKENNPQALLHYYSSLREKTGNKEADEKLDKATRENITRLLGDPDGKGKGGGGGGGGGGGQEQPKDGQGKGDKGPPQQPKNGEDHKDQKQAPKFSGTDVSEGEARQILESVTGEEREVQKRKAQSESKDRARAQNAERGKVKNNGRDTPW